MYTQALLKRKLFLCKLLYYLILFDITQSFCACISRRVKWYNNKRIRVLGPILYDTSVAHRLRGSKSERAREKGRDRPITTYLEVAPQPLPHSQDTFDAFKRETCTYLGKNKKLPRPTCNYIRISIKSFVARISLCREAEAVKRRKKEKSCTNDYYCNYYYHC